MPGVGPTSPYVRKVVLVFQDGDKLRDLADGKWHAGVDAEAAAKAGDVGTGPAIFN